MDHKLILKLNDKISRNKIKKQQVTSNQNYVQIYKGEKRFRRKKGKKKGKA